VYQKHILKIVLIVVNFEEAHELKPGYNKLS